MLDDQDRFLILANELSEVQRHFLMMRAHGLSIKECAEKLGLSTDTVTNWPYHAANAEAFREARDLVRSNPNFGELLLHRAIRFRTLNKVYEELTAPKSRADVIRLGAEIEGLIQLTPAPSQPAIMITLQALMPQFAQDIASQYNRMLEAKVEVLDADQQQLAE